MRRLAISTTAILMLLVSCGPPPGGTTAGIQPASTPPTSSDNATVSDALLVDAQQLAKVEGISTDEALRELKLQDLAGPLGAALEKNESKTLVAHWIEHQPEFKIVVIFTHDGEETVKKYVEEGSPLWAVLDIRNSEGQPTEAELQKEQQEAMKLLDSLDLFCDSDTDIKKGQVNVYVTDSKLFNETLAKAGATLPPYVVPVVVYEPLYGPPPFPLNSDPSIHFPQLKMRSGSDMLVLMVGDLTVKNGYLYVGNALVIWQPDYFLSSENGTAVVLDREGKVVAREGEEVVMGGGGIPFAQVNRILKEPLPPSLAGPFHLQASTGTRLSLNFNSELFHLDAIPSDNHTFYFMTAKPALDEAITQKVTFAGEFLAGKGQFPLRSPVLVADAKPEENKTSVEYTVFWPAWYAGRIVDGVFEVVDNNGNVVVRDGDRAIIDGRALYDYNSAARQLSDELPGALFGPYLIVDKVTG